MADELVSGERVRMRRAALHLKSIYRDPDCPVVRISQDWQRMPYGAQVGASELLDNPSLQLDLLADPRLYDRVMVACMVDTENGIGDWLNTHASDGYYEFWTSPPAWVKQLILTEGDSDEAAFALGMFRTLAVARTLEKQGRIHHHIEVDPRIMSYALSVFPRRLHPQLQSLGISTTLSPNAHRWGQRGRR